MNDDHHHEPVAEQFEDLYEAAIEAEQVTGWAGETTEEAKRHLLVRVGRVSLGLVVVGVGLALIPLPGPGLLIVAGGLALMSRDVPFARRWLDRVRSRLPEGEDGHVAAWVIVVSVAGLLVSVGTSLWWALVR
ncbi:MAG TPA: PGPGW domain-containing protein [Acidimicrobiales bacterium]